MAKYFGKIGYISTQETRPGVWRSVVTEREYYGDVIRNTRRLDTAEQVNDNIDISNQISIVADPFAYENFHSMRYVEFMGTKWKVRTVDVQYPRLILTLGGVYNEQE
jgi:hypothetical protein